MFAFSKRKKYAWERFGPVVDERSIIEKLHHQVLNRSIASLNQPTESIWRPPGRLQSVFGGRDIDSRVFLAAASLTLEFFWGRVIIACYTGVARQNNSTPKKTLESKWWPPE
ncbi:hypothetical protein PoB_001846500 [Plakobranchus ocellatus]|uniref:Uncharacterized protein n=1 Tax=Plakobranchus ocellatus TaxID=259542 RepID=A0AAV3ZBL3_9GAST|nr:hypothetical protein PoB_001846500 [Plakobranchus ocellatus]